MITQERTDGEAAVHASAGERDVQVGGTPLAVGIKQLAASRTLMRAQMRERGECDDEPQSKSERAAKAGRIEKEQGEADRQIADDQNNGQPARPAQFHKGVEIKPACARRPGVEIRFVCQRHLHTLRAGL